MIGQTNLQSRIEQLIENGTFPRFSILVGPKGSGKKTLANWIRRCMGQSELTISYEATDVKIDTIRDIIDRWEELTTIKLSPLNDWSFEEDKINSFLNTEVQIKKGVLNEN